MITTILGKKGHGKTTMANKLVKERQNPACIIVDLFNQFGEYKLVGLGYLYNCLKDGIWPSIPVRIAIYTKDDFDTLCEIVSRSGPITFVVDEVDFFDGPRSQVDSFKKLIHYSRHYKVDLITTSRRPANISRDLTSQTDKFYFFRLMEGRDLAYIADLAGDETAEKVKQLEKYQFEIFA